MDSRLSTSEANLAQVTLRCTEAERRAANLSEEMGLHKSQCVSLTQLLHDSNQQLEAAKKREAALTASLEEQKRKVCTMSSINSLS